MIRRIVLIFAILVVSASAFVAPTSRNAGELKKRRGERDGNGAFRSKFGAGGMPPPAATTERFSAWILDYGQAQRASFPDTVQS
jgi:hypothetical protein